MKYFGTSEQPRKLLAREYLPMAASYWGVMPLPVGAEIIGGYSDCRRAGALIKLKNGSLVCGNSGCITTVGAMTA